MKVRSLENKITIRPTDKKLKTAKKTVKNMFEPKNSILPKEMPIEKKAILVTPQDLFERVKNSIQVSIDNMGR